MAEIRKHTPHAPILQAIESFVDREEQREAFRQAGIRAHEEFMQTGLHLTNTEAKAWLAELAVGRDVEPPICHIQ